MKFPAFLALALLSSACVMQVHSADVPVVDEDVDLPQPFDAALSQSLLENSPFTRSLNLSDSLTLTGIAYVEGKPVATLLNRATKESYIVSEEPNAQGWKLAVASPDPELRHTKVSIMVGPEIVTVRYGDDQLSPEHAKRSSGPSHEPSSMPSSGIRTSYKSSSYLGENGNERYRAMSDAAREKYKDAMHKLIDKHPEMTTEQRSVYAEKYYAKAQAEDQKQAGGNAPEKGIKAPKVQKSIRTK